ncbi:unnamed protein product [Allacma fusca]|uniref:CRAL-TRIO domain-containing protein n=1 Tax=Allacma fusca TaxID=39272 RepID=A0A8J2PDF2_9HEXA|nr:unnamed protein product [Allacma fusca]
MVKIFGICALFCAVALVTSRDVNHPDYENDIYPLELLEKFPYYLSGYDNEGSPVWVMEFGKWDVRALVEAGGDLRWAFDSYMEAAWQRMVLSGQNKGGFNLIFNLDEYDPQQARHLDTLYTIINNFGMKFGQAVKTTDLKRLFVLHENTEFDPIWKLNLNFWGELGQQVEIYGNNKDVYIPRLLSLIRRTELPQHYGGIGSRWPAQIYG